MDHRLIKGRVFRGRKLATTILFLWATPARLKLSGLNAAGLMAICLGPRDEMTDFNTYSRSSRRTWERAAKRRHALDSFTLVEVVLAIAIVAFALISMMGLMAYASQLVQQADSFTRLSNVSSQVVASLDSQAFAVSSTNVIAGGAYYFTHEGLPTNSFNAYFQCTLSNVTVSPSPPAVMQVQVAIRWPAPHFSNTNWILTSVLNYD